MRTLTILILLIFCKYIYSQDWNGEDLIDDPLYYSAQSPQIPTLKSTDNIKYIRINIHYIVKDDGYGNFAKNWDGISASNNYNGYLHAQEIIDICNNRYLSINRVLKFQPIPPVDAEPINYRYVLSGVFFHYDTYYWDVTNFYVNGEYNSGKALSALSSAFVNNKGEAINIYLTTYGHGGGVAYLSGAFVEAHGYYNDQNGYPYYLRYLKETGVKDDWGFREGWVPTMNHEVGHNLSLEHTIRLGGGTCCDGKPYICDDGCDDTPTYQEMLSKGNPSPCDWGGTNSSNNMMDYDSDANALSPCQIEKMHEHLENYKTTYYSCYYKINSLTLNSNITDNQSLIAKSITIPSGASVTISNYNSLYLNAEEVTISGEFTVENGSVFTVNITPSCN